MEFCARHQKGLDAAWASLPSSASSDATSNPPASLPSSGEKPTAPHNPAASTELSTILLSLRKLREAVVATASTVPIAFSQHVYILSIKISIQARHPPSYYPSLRRLLEELHSASHPLPDSDLRDVVSYLLLDYACRQEDMAAAYQLRARARREYGFQSSIIDRVLTALAHDNWVEFWRVRKEVDSSMRAVMNWAEDRVRRLALKAVSKAYLSTDARWITEGCTGDRNWTWEKLAAAENLGWEKDGDKIIIKRPKKKPQTSLAPIKENP
ncbi:hypothetical protein BO70DRAFT_357628 [Aspergillus heteromorphus CBS 117.55]|uniref:CSN8/PSMD8/EIF3K domain-containing protein n=1 Tax=Aspergillus heteromorphus CBS 117.55 TaxID=1448321 RepID=A0A317X1R2_9EURO|nr:uncharacterized protein BO70DRAFT_357628 [Aspergillus heteromorphus CBS 117.55]PWY92493.1 hypothetical protein BO70DRAFT_357628 [Aspergillus heteromorphus CBS 117.55]